MTPTFAWSLRDVGQVMQQMEGVLGEVPPHLFVPASLLMAYMMVTGKMLAPEDAPRFVEDMTALMGVWKVETYQ